MTEEAHEVAAAISSVSRSPAQGIGKTRGCMHTESIGDGLGHAPLERSGLNVLLSRECVVVAPHTNSWEVCVVRVLGVCED